MADIRCRYNRFPSSNDSEDVDFCFRRAIACAIRWPAAKQVKLGQRKGRGRVILIGVYADAISMKRTKQRWSDTTQELCQGHRERKVARVDPVAGWKSLEV